MTLAYETPAAPAGQITYEWNGLSHPVYAHLIFSPFERATRDCPAEPASCELTAAYLKGVDITELLDSDVIAEIEEKAAAAQDRYLPASQVAGMDSMMGAL